MNVIMDNQTYEEIKLANKAKTTSVTVASRVPQWLKGKILQQADDKGTTVGEYIAMLMYGDVNNELVKRSEYEELQEKWKSEANLHNQAVKDLEELKKKNTELEKQVKEGEKRYATVLEEFDKQAGEAGDMEAQVKEKDQQISKLNKRIEELTKQRDESKQKHKDEVKKLKDQSSNKDKAIKGLEQERDNALTRLKKANQWIEGHSGDFLGHEYPGEF
jgi:chromosome segregation ATPase